jgi:hypothetical protein
VIVAHGAVTIKQVIIMAHVVVDMDMVIMKAMVTEVMVTEVVGMKVMAVDMVMEMDMGTMAGNRSRK